MMKKQSLCGNDVIQMASHITPGYISHLFAKFHQIQFISFPWKSNKNNIVWTDRWEEITIKFRLLWCMRCKHFTYPSIVQTKLWFYLYNLTNNFILLLAFNTYRLFRTNMFHYDHKICKKYIIYSLLCCDTAELVGPWVVFSVVWSVGATCNHASRELFSNWLRQTMEEDEEMKLSFPDSHLVYDYRPVEPPPK